MDVASRLNSTTDGTGKNVLESVNTLVYDTLMKVIEPGSATDVYFVSTDSASDLDGRHGLLDLVKGMCPHWCAPIAPGGTRRFTVRVQGERNPPSILATESRPVRENQAAGWTRRNWLYDMLDVDFYRGIVDDYAMPDECHADVPL
ncbi:hypothetical protein CYMTET_7863 [Cymbomonas tetramitiformis]|uniref:Uncharacterized protein n=1 Tax=Cymbomonas tetramitiformis TaxID=36881 RepID=A0AAE0GW48_9CHLO|nr:hypothetical protein CYMTET_7863 [Cymbomonas tetramitiformis]